MHLGELTDCTYHDRWKLGQLRAGSTIRFQRVTFKEAQDLYRAQENFFRGLQVSIEFSSSFPPSLPLFQTSDGHIDPRLHETPPSLPRRSSVVFRQAGDSAILVEFGDMELDFVIRAQIHAFETEVRKRATPGVWFLAPCIRSTMVSRRLVFRRYLLKFYEGALRPTRRNPRRCACNAHRR